MIAFGSSFPGKILPLEVGPGKEMVLQKRSFLASETGVELHVEFQKKLGAGFLGGEGFIVQRLSGQGMAFVEIEWRIGGVSAGARSANRGGYRQCCWL